jgi:hypothetical protein
VDASAALRLPALFLGDTPPPSSDDKSDLLFSLLVCKCTDVGLPADAKVAYDPFQVDLLFVGLGEEIDVDMARSGDPG